MGEDFSDAFEALDQFQPDAMLVDYDLGAPTGWNWSARQHCVAIRFGNYADRSRQHRVDLSDAGRCGDYLVKGEVTAPMLDRTLRYAIEQQQTKNDCTHQRPT